MADTDTQTLDASPQWQPPPPTNDVLATAMQQNQPQQNELDRLPAPAPQPQQNELQTLGNQTAPIASQPVQQGNAPNPPTSPSEWKHMEGLHQVLNKVADILGPSEIAHVRQDPKTGDWTVEKGPATTAEKWHRIAAAALGGAATGLANAQGPGGLARATAAGVQTGLQMPQQQTERAQQEASFNQQQQLAIANRIYLAQQTGRMAADAKLAGQKFSEEEEGILNRQADMLASDKNARDVGSYDPSDPDAARMLAMKDPEARDAFLNKGDKRLRYMLEADHKIHVFVTDKNEEDQRITEPVEILGEGHDGNAPILTSKMGGVGKTLKEIRDSNAAVQNQVLQHQKLYGEYQKNMREKDAKENDFEQYYSQYIKDNNLPDNAANRLKARRDYSNATEKPSVVTNLYSPNPDGTYTPYKPQPGQPLKEGTVTAAGLNAKGISTQPFNKPVATPGTYDAAYPPVQNFDPGTTGIVPKDIGKVPAKVTTNADLARNIMENSAAAERIIAQRPDLFGAIQGRFTSVEEMLGSDDENMRDLAQRFSNIAKATVGIHGSRSRDLVHDEEKKLFNGFLAGPNGIRGAMNANTDSAKTFLQTEKNFQTYGSSTGPDRALDKGLKPMGNAPPPSKGNRSIADAMKLEVNKGKSRADVEADLKLHGYNPI